MSRVQWVKDVNNHNRMASKQVYTSLLILLLWHNCNGEALAIRVIDTKTGKPVKAVARGQKSRTLAGAAPHDALSH
jgi:hypothetical protein